MAGRALSVLLLLALLCARPSLCGTAPASSSQPVTARLAAKWPATPLLLEASEFIAEDGNEKFWQFLETVRELTVYKQGDSEYSYYNLILKKAGQFLSNLQINLLKFALSIRAYSPTVQMFQQIAADEPPPEGCRAFVVIHEKHTCKTNEIKKLLKKATKRPRPYLFKGDHKFPTFKEDGPVVVLYAEMGTKDFVKFHKILSEKAQKEEIVYVLRHYVQKPVSRKMYLSGYSVELAIKSTEYKAVDDTQVKGANETKEEEDEEEEEESDVQGFLFGKLKQIYPDLKNNLKEFKKHLIETANNMEPLKVWELQDLSFQAAARIMSTPVYDALKVMKDIAQNFPIRASLHFVSQYFQLKRSLTRVTIDKEMRNEIEENQKHLHETLGIQPGEAHLFLNGLPIDLDFHDPFSILETLKLEGKVMHGLHELGIKEETLSKFMRLHIHPTDNSYALDIRHSSIVWINNIEQDHSYSTWPESYQELLRPTLPGVLQQIRRNLHNLVLFVDPVQEDTGDYMKVAELFYHYNVPLRIGIVFILNTKEEIDGNEDAGIALWRSFNYIAEEYDTFQAFTSIIKMYHEVRDGSVLTVDDVKDVLRSEYPNADVQSILGVHSEHDEGRKAGATFYKKSGLGPLPQVLFNGVPFNRDEMDVEELETVILQRIIDATKFFQRAVFMGLLNDHMNAIDFLMDQNNVVSRINPTILGAERRYIHFRPTSVPFDAEDFSTFSFLDSQDKSAVISDNMKYLTRKDEDAVYAVTIWIIADFDKPSGRQLLSNALKSLKTSSHIRVGILNNPSSKIKESNTAIARGILTAFLTQSNSNLKSFLSKLSKEETAKSLAAGTKITKFLIPGMDGNTFEKKYNTLGLDLIKTHQMFCQEVLKLLPGQMAVMSNGRVLGPLDENEFSAEDFDLLEKITYSTSAEKIKALVKQMGNSSKSGSDLVMKIDALLSSLPKTETRQDAELLKEQHSVVKVNPQQNEPFYDVIAIVDPLTREAQKMSHLLIVLKDVINMKLRLFLNCKSKLSELPLKSFYRFVLEPELIYGINKHLPSEPVAKFLELPESPLLTLNMITPESWLVEAVNSSCDLDNIHLQEVKGAVIAEYELEYILLEGHCFDVTTGQPPRGLQFTLGTKKNPVMVDTVVMANLGYFQLKANPGAWMLRLRKGRSEEIYQVFSHEGTDSVADLTDVTVVLNNFRSKIIKIQVQKKPDKINEDLLTDGTTGKYGNLESLTRFSEGIPTEESEKKSDILNIFSVASGHLYERFLRIMMLSVLRHTKTPVKFWFLKNYLSPTFKDVIPHMAKKYGFNYELVQYKWPRWLYQQTEKQRIIWGYKILFLDVLFPLAVDKIIFVDADQIVRSDLKELRDLDLNGAPYGYTPFCDSRKEMDGYRFWKSGYWASHLGKRKYHISALYVVDLKTFRKIAAGDRLRGQYQALSQDPNSLSNLDQDLPNNMIHQVAIKSLPQEWLWCETWCDDESKKKAKTIDLCNNPQTKEPKLEAAARIVPEWIEYDSEIRKLIQQIEKEKKNPTSLFQKVLKHDEL
ncbi:UDP-glucose:glycoprotein glucosyltransferase 2 isoform X1 [Myiozetetes cayanensis]|uniref:UDP-glucose:glycoprotein glucosyltransferase 2 isoform X1 n=2 Tax=Myiozetetes cayanensis TaxID=478635 RepID=UPI00215E430E|nr:UDP-glucose:glycoprotein glucosyltransferase 2 isoform X1 [Myiozetetes cayanensis]